MLFRQSFPVTHTGVEELKTVPHTVGTLGAGGSAGIGGGDTARSTGPLKHDAAFSVIGSASQNVGFTTGVLFSTCGQYSRCEEVLNRQFMSVRPEMAPAGACQVVLNRAYTDPSAQTSPPAVHLFGLGPK